MTFNLFKYLTTLGFIYIYGRLILHYGEMLWAYMMNERILWNTKIERPRILFMGLGLGVMHLAVYSWYTIESETLLVVAISFLVFLAGFFLSILPWTDKFKSSMQGQKPVSSLKKDKNFNLNISEDQAQKLYHNLMRYDLLNSEKTSLQDFRNIFTKDWDTHNSKIHFNMDGPSSHEFYEYLSKEFPKNTMTIKNLFITSELVLRADGKKYKYNTLKNAPTRSSFSKKHSELNEIFRKIDL
ncbi:hypothetical protein SAMN05660776_0940 [Salegentibacter holothuriorum]|uniref:Uncharacterized protein n=1 Tax=Salegentibacter holothuriorum TaxID=241145 RepID=A0A1T5AXP3_9FLAO|nr:hypothetical protein [Salegentibacter holothuriorum]SKB39589.1 hypothetical protein SAMN05660776_0940 [Salegentibacter holothuriorum]